MSEPEILVRANVLNSNFSRDWTNIGDYVYGLTTQIGRSTELDTFQAGSIALSIDNDQGMFTPSRTGFVKNLLRPEIAVPPLTTNGTQYFGMIAGSVGSINDSAVWSAPGGTLAGATAILSSPAIGYVVPVTVGASYAVRWNVTAAGGAINHQAAIRWFTSGMVFISDSVGSAMSDAGSITLTATAPATAAYAAVALVNASTWPGGYTATVATIQFELGPQTALELLSPFYPYVLPGARVEVYTELRRNNMCPNPDMTTNTQWVDSGGTGSTAVLPGTAQARSGVAYNDGFRIVTGAPSTTSSRSGFITGITPGFLYQMAVWCRVAAPVNAANVQLFVEWYNSSNVLLSTVFLGASELGGGFGNLFGGVFDPWGRIDSGINGGAPATAAKAKLLVQGGTAVEVHYARAYFGLPGDYQFAKMFSGTIEKWPVKFEHGGELTVEEVSGLDLLSELGNAEINSPYRAQVLQSKPTRYYTLSDFADFSGNNGSDAVIVQNKYGAQTITNTDGSDVSAPPAFVGDLSNDGAATAWVPPAANAGAQLRLPNFPMAIGLDSVVEIWCNLTSLPSDTFGTGSSLFNVVQFDPTATLGFRIIAEIRATTGHILYQPFTASAFNVATAVVLGAQTHIVMTCIFNVSSGLYDTTLIVNGVTVDTQFAVPQAVNGSSPVAGIGAILMPSGKSMATTNGSLSHFACYYGFQALVVDPVKNYNTGATADKSQNDYLRVAYTLTQAATARTAGATAIASDFGHTRKIDASLATKLQAKSWAAGTSPLQIIQDVAKAADAVFFASPGGVYTYKTRRQRLNPAVLWTFNEAAGTGVEPGFSVFTDIDRVVNDYTGKQTGGRAYRATDATSVSTFGRRPSDIEIAVDNPAEVADAINWKLSKTKDALVQIDGVQIDPCTSDALWAVALQGAIGDLVQVVGLPTTAPQTTIQAFIESIRHDIVKNGTRMEWHTSFNLSSAERSQGWILGDQVFGVLGFTTRLVY